MADYSTASSNANSAINSSSEGFVEEYEISQTGRKVKRGRLKDQIGAALLLEGIAARRSSGGAFRLAKLQEPKS